MIFNHFETPYFLIILFPLFSIRFLLDTGDSTGTLRAFVEGLTDKEILVANTHFNSDHSAGNGEFERVFLSKGAEIDAPYNVKERLDNFYNLNL